MPFSTGLVSVTFRKLSVTGIVHLVRAAGLDGIEWGGDIHVPPGDLPRAREAAKLTADAGLRVPAYGSYYRVGTHSVPGFEEVAETAKTLGAPVIRVWAGDKSTADATESDWQRVIEDSLRIAEIAEQAGLTVAFEHHGGTLTDTLETSERLLAATAPRLKTLWQPAGGLTVDERAESLRVLLPRVTHIHVFHWTEDGRRPLEEGAEDWRRYLEIAGSAGRDIPLLLEFVADDAVGNFQKDARVLKEWVETS